MWLNPWALFFLAAIGVPIVVHFLTRPRPVVIPSSTLRFVRELVEQRRARHWLRDFLTLMFRTLAILLMVLAMGRPRTGQQPLISRDDDSDAVRVVLLDTSQSMAAVDRGAELFERARAAAAEQLKYRPNLRANLVLAAAAPRAVFDQPSQNFDALRDELARAAIRPEPLDVSRALSLATEILAPRDASDERKRELVIVSDFQRSNWARADFSVLPRETKIQLESVAPKTRLANLAIAGVRVAGQKAEQAEGRVEVDIGNWSPSPQSVTVEVQIGDVSRKLNADCPPGRQTTISDEFAVSSIGWHTGTARLIFSGDALATDDQFPVTVEVRSHPTYLIITRQPTSLRPSSSHFLECALAPGGSSANSSAEPRVIRFDPDKLDAEVMAKSDLIVLDHPGALNANAIQMLAGAMRRGRPVFYLASEAADATTLVRLSNELGRGLRLPVEFQPFPVGQRRKDQSVATVRYDARPFNALGESAAGLVRGWRLGGGLVSHPTPDALEEDVLATYADGSVCLIYTMMEAAPLAVLNADLGISNLPAQSSFVPLIDELVQLLTERRAISSLPQCGQSLVVRLPSAVTTAHSLEIIGPPSAKRDDGFGELQDEAGGVIWRWARLGSPGVYQVRQNQSTVFALPVSIAAEESELESLSADVLSKRLAAENTVYFRQASESEQPRDPWWTWLMVASVVCLLCELGTLLVFRK